MVRQYAASFGLDVPGRATGAMATAGVADALRKLHGVRPRATEVVVIAPAPARPPDELRDAVTRVRKRGVRVRWAAVDPGLGLETPEGGGGAVRDALEVELALSRKAAVRALLAIGVRVVEARSLFARRPRRPLEDSPSPSHAPGQAGGGAAAE